MLIAQQGRQFVPVVLDQVELQGYDLTFKCLLPSDPAVAKFQLQRTH
jgi:hypothetical protein